MKPKNIRQHIEDYYVAKKLPRTILEDLESAVAAAGGVSPKKTGFPFVNWIPILKNAFKNPATALIGALCVVVLVQFIFFANGPSRPPKDAPYTLESAVISEISMNHNKNLAIEFKVSAIEDLSHAMAKLDFTPVTPRSLNFSNYTLTGARYCSIQGRLAVLINLVDKSGKRYSLYQAPLNQTLSQLHKSTTEQDGIAVNLWNEGSIFMGLATSTLEE